MSKRNNRISKPPSAYRILELEDRVSDLQSALTAARAEIDAVKAVARETVTDFQSKLTQCGEALVAARAEIEKMRAVVKAAERLTGGGGSIANLRRAVSALRAQDRRT